MVISAELHAQILRYYHVEKWRRGTIARQIGVHRDVVARVLAQSGIPAPGPPQRPMRIDPYLPFILATLEAFPTLTAARLYAMVYERGYRGSPDHFRHLIARHRPRPKAEAYLRLRALPGEEAQVDWGHFGHLQIGRARRPLMAFVMVLSYSRRLFLRFFLDARMDAFLTGHALAFEAFGARQPQERRPRATRGGDPVQSHAPGCRRDRNRPRGHLQPVDAIRVRRHYAPAIVLRHGVGRGAEVTAKFRRSRARSNDRQGL